MEEMTKEKKPAKTYIKTAHIVLSNPAHIYDRAMKAFENTERAESKARGLSGIAYDREKVQTSFTFGSDLVNYVHLKAKYEDLIKLFVNVCEETSRIIDASDATGQQKLALRLHCVSVPFATSPQIADRMHISVQSAEQLIRRGVLNVARYLEKQAQNGAEYTFMCVICGKQFKTSNPARLTCSKSCSGRLSSINNMNIYGRHNISPFPEANSPEQKARNTYVRKRIDILKQMCIPAPTFDKIAALCNLEQMSEIAVDAWFRSYIQKAS